MKKLKNANEIKNNFKFHAVGNVHDIPKITGNSTSVNDTGAFFLGPRGENRELLNSLIENALQHTYKYRDDYLPGDPEVITESIKSTQEYKKNVQIIQSNFNELLEYFNKYETPFFSLRYQAHMLWDNTLPSIAGYFAGMLHNPNNVTMQASTSTTPLEIIVCQDLCYMVGYSKSLNNNIEPFSHLTSDGSLSVEEAVWATREMKFFPFALREAFKKAKNSEKEYQFLLPAIDLELLLCNGEVRTFLESNKYKEASDWELFNIKMSDILDFPERIANICGIEDIYDVWNPIEDLNINSVGWHNMWPICSSEGNINIPKMATPSTKHYSWPKSGALIGIGWNGVENILVDQFARLDVEELDVFLKKCLDNKTPLLTVTCVFGSTEEGAVDPLDKVLNLREKYKALGLEFNIHVDAAWGGYLSSIIRNPYLFDEEPTSEADLFIDNYNATPVSDYVIKQIKSLNKADSMTIDPHKYGYIQYSCGSILYKDGRMKTLTTFSGAYIGGSGTVNPGTAPTVGCFGLEGSRPGATAAALYLSHMCIRPDINGYGQIISESLWNAKRFYIRLLLLQTEKFKTITLTPIKQDHIETLQNAKDFIFDNLKSNISHNSSIMKFIRDIGPDQCIVDYIFNFYNKDGSLNSDVDKFKAFNEEIYKIFSLPDHKEPVNIHSKNSDGSWRYQFFLTLTEFDRISYGDKFMNNFIDRLGLNNNTDQLPCFRSVIMDPYISDTVDGSYFKNIFEILKKEIDKLADKYQAL